MKHTEYDEDMYEEILIYYAHDKSKSATIQEKPDQCQKFTNEQSRTHT